MSNRNGKRHGTAPNIGSKAGEGRTNYNPILQFGEGRCFVLLLHRWVPAGAASGEGGTFGFAAEFDKSTILAE